MAKTIIGTIVTLILIFGFIIVSPIVGIWSLNTLFPTLAIPYSLNTWLAFTALAGVIHTICIRK